MNPSHLYSSDSVPSKEINLSELEWVPLCQLWERKSASDFCHSTSTDPRLAKDEAYADAVIDSWRGDRASRKDCKETIGATLKYQRSSDGVDLYGYVCCPKSIIEGEKKAKKSLPVVLLLHTAIGPQDLFLRWKADSLINDLMGSGDCIVFIADLFSDSEGWGWSDRSRYDSVRSSLLEQSQNTSSPSTRSRWKLQETLFATLDTVRSMDHVNPNKVAALGYCFGGYSIFEFGRMRQSCLKALVSYHGVFGDQDSLQDEDDGYSDHFVGPKVLLCNGNDDPFVSVEDVECCKKVLEERYACSVTVANFEFTKHGFTNPAQDFNPNESFAFNADAAKASWQHTIDLLEETLYEDP